LGLVQEFKTFATKGNVADIAVGLIIGASFGKIVTSLVNDILMPPIGVLVGKVDFTNLFVVLDAQVFDNIQKAKEAGAPVIAYGQFLQNTFDFIIVAFAIFMVIKGLNKLKKAEEKKVEPAEPPVPSREEILLGEIRDLLKTK